MTDLQNATANALRRLSRTADELARALEGRQHAPVSETAALLVCANEANLDVAHAARWLSRAPQNAPGAHQAPHALPTYPEARQ
jgi:hypothetical protein